MAEVLNTDYPRGRRLVWIVIAITFGYEALTVFFYGFVTLQMFGRVTLPINVDLFIRLILEAGFLYCVYRGYGWARWIMGILFALGALFGLLGLLQVFSAGALLGSQGSQQFVMWISLLLVFSMLIAYAASAITMLGSSSVRAFQDAQRGG